MEFEIRQINKEKDYDRLVMMWNGYDFPPIPKRALPEKGLMISDRHGEPLAAGFFYSTDSSIALLEWVVGNPFADKEERSRALDVLIEYLTAWAKGEGFELMFSYSKSKKYNERLEKHEWARADENMTHFMRRLS